MNFEIISLNHSELVDSIGKALNKKIIKFKCGKFADSEIYIKPKSIPFKNKHILIIHQFSFLDRTINDQFLELLFLSDLTIRMGANNISIILPYYPYSRQDKYPDGKFYGGVFLIDKLLNVSGVSRVLACELHKSSVIKKFITNTYEIPLIDFAVKFFKKNGNNHFNDNGICFLSPDEGRLKYIKSIAKLAGTSFAYVKKKRLKKDRAVSIELIGNVKDKNVILIDDIIDTGNTAIGACNLAIKNGAKKVVGFFTHAVLSKNSIKKLNKSKFEKIFITDTVLLGNKLKSDDKISIVSVADVLIQFLRDHYL